MRQIFNTVPRGSRWFLVVFGLAVSVHLAAHLVAPLAALANPIVDTKNGVVVWNDVNEDGNAETKIEFLSPTLQLTHIIIVKSPGERPEYSYSIESEGRVSLVKRLPVAGALNFDDQTKAEIFRAMKLAGASDEVIFKYVPKRANGQTGHTISEEMAFSFYKKIIQELDFSKAKDGEALRKQFWDRAKEIIPVEGAPDLDTLIHSSGPGGSGFVRAYMMAERLKTSEQLSKEDRTKGLDFCLNQLKNGVGGEFRPLHAEMNMEEELPKLLSFVRGELLDFYLPGIKAKIQRVLKDSAKKSLKRSELWADVAIQLTAEERAFLKSTHLNIGYYFAKELLKFPELQNVGLAALRAAAREQAPTVGRKFGLDYREKAALRAVGLIGKEAQKQDGEALEKSVGQLLNTSLRRQSSENLRQKHLWKLAVGPHGIFNEDPSLPDPEFSIAQDAPSRFRLLQLLAKKKAETAEIKGQGVLAVHSISLGVEKDLGKQICGLVGLLGIETREQEYLRCQKREAQEVRDEAIALQAAKHPAQESLGNLAETKKLSSSQEGI